MTKIINFIVIPLIIWVLSQSVKFIIHIKKGGKVSGKTISWIYQWASGVPSTHAAMLTASLYLLATYNGFDAIFGFAFVVALLLIYNELAHRKKQELFQEHLKSSKDDSLKKIVKDGSMLDISGHSYFEVITGIVFGLIMVIILEKIF